jgi:geranylgeranyl diphosphate synthase type I
VGYFLAFEALAAMSAPPEGQRRVLELCARELSFVGVAQMQDLHNGACPAEVTDEQVLRLHLYKTGRYSFSLPLMVGALLAGAPELALQHLEKLGGLLGVLFQIRDDELGLFGDTHRIGKPAGSDVREGKKTLYYSHLLRRAAGADRRRLDAIYGHPDSGPQELAFVRELATRLGVREAVAAAARGLAQEAGQMIQSLPVHREEHRQVFEQLLAFAQERPS